VDGSSTVYPLMEAVAEELRRANADLRITVGISGTGGGFKKFCAGEIDVQDASRPISPSEVEHCQRKGVAFVEIPVAYDGIVIVVHPSNTWATSITTAELARLWAPEAQGRVTRWNQIRESWPDREIHLFGAGVDSGTYDYFTEAVLHREHASRGDYASSEDDNVLVHGVAGDELALGFFSLAYYEANKNKLRALPIDDGRADNGDGPIAPSIESLQRGTYQPFARPVFIYAAARALDRPAVSTFVQQNLSVAPRLAREVGFVPLPDRAYELGRLRIAERRTGTIFKGTASAIGMPIEKLLEREQAKPGS
jgi:phosphate transport system substrate-binding protein